MTDIKRADDAHEIDRQFAEPLLRVTVSVDELHAARIAGRIEAAIDRIAEEKPAGARTRHHWYGAAWRVGLALSLGAAVAAAMVVAGGGRHSVVVTTAAPAAAPAAMREPSLMVPYIYSGPGADEQTLDPSRRLVVGAGARVRAAIGTRVRLTLVGPGAVTVAPASQDGGIELVLERGRLLVDFEGRGAAPLRVRSPGALTTVVGTLFAVEAEEGATRVAVVRGRIRVQSAAGKNHTVVAGDACTAADGAVARISAEIAQALAEHDASPAPPVGEYGIVHVEAGSPALLALDGRTLAGPGMPIVARVPAGSHVLDAAGEQLRVDVGGGHTVRVQRDSPLWNAPAGTVSGRGRPRDESKETRRQPRAPSPPSIRPQAAAGTAEAAYLAAEGAMRSGARVDAQRALENVVTRDADGRWSEAALLDLARLALEGGDTQQARRYLRRLPDPANDRALAEAAHHLRCRLEVKVGDDAEATSCLRAFRQRYPRSPHDAESLALLADITRTCDEARSLLDQYLRLYPRGRFAAAAAARLAACITVAPAN